MGDPGKWVLDITLPEFIAEEAGVSEKVADKVVNLFSQGNEVAYIARYRGDVHGGMTCDQLRKAYETFNETRELNKKADKAIINVQSKAKSAAEAELAVDRIRQARDTTDVQEVMKTYASGRKTKADAARELGLGESAELILQGKTVNITQLVSKKNKDLGTVEKVKEQLTFCIADSLNRLPETVDIVKKISRLETRAFISVVAELSSKAKKWKETDKEYRLIAHFSNYLNFRKDARRVENYQVLALDRGEEENVLTWKIEVKQVDHMHPGKAIQVSRDHSDLFSTALADSINRLFIPKIQRAVRKHLKMQAEESAISCFSRNLAQLFSQEGLTNRFVVALDPGFSACKAAFLSPNGDVIETCDFGLRGRRLDEKGESVLKRWSKQCNGRLSIAIGNGKASLETQFAVAHLIASSAFGSTRVEFCVVSECGASKYSITPLAEEELPGMKVTHRSAVSIGRRLQDPMAEYVKIEPKHLGMGMYQHSVNDRRLREALALVVRERVSLRGVDVNNASLQLLQQVCGLNKRSAGGIIALRKEKGRITSREELKTAQGVGPKVFEQCAGFLTVSPDNSSESEPKNKRRKISYEPLDATIVHPSSYKMAKSILARANISEDQINSSETKSKLLALKDLSVEEKMVVDLLLTKEKTVPHPPLLTQVRSVASLQVGEVLLGRVDNKVDFGIFIDIGAEKTALAHRSCLRHPYPEIGSQLMVVIDKVEMANNRVSVHPLY